MNMLDPTGIQSAAEGSTYVPEGLLDFLFHIFTSQLVPHHDGEFREIQFSIVVHIDFVHDIHDLVLGGIASKRSH